MLCLGNSLTYLFRKSDLLETLNNFKRLLRKGGILIVDERNYQYILDNKKEILGGYFNYSAKYVYCGNKVHGYPVAISANKVVFEYDDKIRNKKAQLTLYPFKRNELLGLIESCGFGKVAQYSDYKEKYAEDADFYLYVCTK